MKGNNKIMKTLILMFFCMVQYIHLCACMFVNTTTVLTGEDGCIVFQLNDIGTSKITVTFLDTQVLIVFPAFDTVIIQDDYKNRITNTANLTENRISFCLHNVSSSDMGSYNLIASNIEHTVDLIVLVPVSIVNIFTLPVENDSNPVIVIEGENQRFQCRTNPVHPKAVIKWYIGDITIKNEINSTKSDGNTLTTISEITYTGNISDDTKMLYCTAENIDGFPSISSTNKTLDIKYGPAKVNLYPTNQTYTVIENSDSIGPINCTAICKPKCAISWSGPGLADIDAPYLKIMNITRNQTGSYHCNAKNAHGSGISLVVNVTVYYAPKGKPIITQSPERIIQGGTIKLTCTLSGGNPHALLSWDCGSHAINTSSNTTTSSMVSLNVTKDENGKVCNCLATQSATGYSVKVQHTINVYFAPVNPLLVIQSPSGPIDTDTYVTLTCEVSGGNPLAELKWNCGSNDINKTTGITASYGSRFKVNKTFNGKQCTCSAYHIDPSYNSTLKHPLIVYYPPSPPAIMLSLPLPVFEGNTTKATCTVDDSGNPKFETLWKWNHTTMNVFLNETITIGPVTKHDNGSIISCYVHNNYTNSHNIELQDSATLDIEYYPIVILDPNVENKSITEVEGKPLNVKCSVHGNPKPTAKWFYGDAEKLLFEGGKAVNLTISHVEREQKGRYYCKANSTSSTFGHLRSSAYMDLIVHYPPDVNINYTEQDQGVALECNASGIPTNYFYKGWKQTYNGIVIRNSEKLVMHTQNKNKELILRHTSFKDSGNYTCFVNNGIRGLNEELQQFNSTQIYIKGQPELVEKLPADATFSNSKGGNITIDLPFFSFPEIEEGFWYKNSSNLPIKKLEHDNITASVDRKPIETTFYGNKVNVSDYAYHAIIMLSNLEEQFEGEYILVLKNGFKNRNITIFVVISSKPDDPSNLNVTQITSTGITISWNRGYSGGHNQSFNVSVYDNTGFHLSHLIHDNYTVIMQTFNINALNPSTEYVVRLYSENKIGKSNLITINTTTEAATKVQGSSKQDFPVGAVIGGVTGVVLACLAIVFIIFIRRKCLSFGKDTESTGRKKLTDVNKEEEEGDGLRDNVLYESAGQDFLSNQGPSGVEYAVVTKNKEKFKLNGNSNMQETSLYSEVVKKKPNDRKVENNTNAVTSKKLKRKKEGKTGEFLEDVYENMSGKVSSDIFYNQNQQQEKNKDGLVYADLVFNPSENGPKFIHGIDDRTIYADVDTTQKIDPLPDSDEEETIENKEIKETDNK